MVLLNIVRNLHVYQLVSVLRMTQKHNFLRNKTKKLAIQVKVSISQNIAFGSMQIVKYSPNDLHKWVVTAISLTCL